MSVFRYTAADTSVLMSPEDLVLFRGEGADRTWTWSVLEATRPEHRLIQSYVAVLPLVLARGAEATLRKTRKPVELHVTLTELELHDKQGRFSATPIERRLDRFTLSAPNFKATGETAAWLKTLNHRLAHHAARTMAHPNALDTGRVLRITFKLSCDSTELIFDHPWIEP